jgi:predicted transcriptional regulator
MMAWGGDMADFGVLERAIMDALWDASGPILVRELRERVNAGGGRELAYTTVQTVADRLARKGLVQRTRDGRAHRYAAARSREEHVAGLMLEALSDTGERGAVLARFAQLVDRRDAKALLQALSDRSARGQRSE